MGGEVGRIGGGRAASVGAVSRKRGEGVKGDWYFGEIGFNALLQLVDVVNSEDGLSVEKVA
jgi:hypothetical protein